MRLDVRFEEMILSVRTRKKEREKEGVKKNPRPSPHQHIKNPQQKKKKKTRTHTPKTNISHHHQKLTDACGKATSKDGSEIGNEPLGRVEAQNAHRVVGLEPQADERLGRALDVGVVLQVCVCDV